MLHAEAPTLFEDRVGHHDVVGRRPSECRRSMRLQGEGTFDVHGPTSMQVPPFDRSFEGLVFPLRVVALCDDVYHLLETGAPLPRLLELDADFQSRVVEGARQRRSVEKFRYKEWKISEFSWNLTEYV